MVESGGQRQHERHRVRLRPRLRAATRLEYADMACSNLSLGGLFVETPDTPAPGTLVKFECQVAEGASFGGVGVVAWQRAADAQTARGLGIRFVRLSEGSEPVIAALLERSPLEAARPAAVTRSGGAGRGASSASSGPRAGRGGAWPAPLLTAAAAVVALVAALVLLLR